MLHNTTDWKSKSIIPVDGPKAVYMPQTAEHWTMLGLPPPLGQWNCQDASGNLVPSIGTVPLVPGGTSVGNLKYQQSISGWASRGVGVDTYANHHFSTTDPSLDLALDEAFAMLAIVAFGGISTAWGFIMGIAVGDDPMIGAASYFNTSAGGIQLALARAGGMSTPAVNYGTDQSMTTVVPVLLGRPAGAVSQSASGIRYFTDRRATTDVIINAAMPNSFKGIGASRASAPGAAFRCLRFCMWKGANAETILNKATLTTLRWPLTY